MEIKKELTLEELKQKEKVLKEQLEIKKVKNSIDSLKNELKEPEVEVPVYTEKDIKSSPIQKIDTIESLAKEIKEGELENGNKKI